MGVNGNISLSYEGWYQSLASSPRGVRGRDAAYADASRRQKGMKTGSAYLYFELSPPDGRAKVQTIAND